MDDIGKFSCPDSCQRFVGRPLRGPHLESCACGIEAIENPCMVYFPTFTIRINHIYTTPIGVIHIPTRKVTQVTLSVPSFP